MWSLQDRAGFQAGVHRSCVATLDTPDVQTGYSQATMKWDMAGMQMVKSSLPYCSTGLQVVYKPLSLLFRVTVLRQGMQAIGHMLTHAQAATW